MPGAFFAPVVAFIFNELGIQMSNLYNRLADVESTRLSVVTAVAANLVAQLSELNELRERVRKAQLSAQTSRRTDPRKRSRAYKVEAASIRWPPSIPATRGPEPAPFERTSRDCVPVHICLALRLVSYRGWNF
jgi:hypothetical protein